MIRKLIGLLFLLCSLGVFAVTVSAQIAWLAMCFGTVIIGVALLFIAPTILFFPANIGFVTGVSLWVSGMAMISGEPGNKTSAEKPLERFWSHDEGEFDLSVALFLQHQFSAISSANKTLPIDAVTIAYISAVIGAFTKKGLNIAELKPMFHGLILNRDMELDVAFSEALANNQQFVANIRRVAPLAIEEVKAFHGTYLVEYASKMHETRERLTLQS
ncbi:hypothetical protein ACTUVN_002364 [Pseudomonas caspiana]